MDLEKLTLASVNIKNVFFFLRFYLFIHLRHTERGRERSRLLAGNPVLDQESIQDLESYPEPKADPQLLSHPGIPRSVTFFKARAKTAAPATTTHKHTQIHKCKLYLDSESHKVQPGIKHKIWCIFLHKALQKSFIS